MLKRKPEMYQNVCRSFCLLHVAEYVTLSGHIWTFQDEAQTALFKGPVRPTQYTLCFHLGYKNQSLMLYGADVAVGSELKTKQINAICSESTIMEC